MVRPIHTLSDRRVRIGVIGTGWWATHAHLPGLLANEKACVAAVADQDPDRLNAAAAAFGIDRAFTDYRELINGGMVDGVVVATPHATHYRITSDALAAGVHCLVEKPLTLESGESWKLVELARRQRCHLMVGYTFNFTEAADRAYQAFQRKTLGDLTLVAAIYSSIAEGFYAGDPGRYQGWYEYPVLKPKADTYSRPSTAGGGHAVTQLTHALGLLFWLIDSPCRLVAAVADNPVMDGSVSASFVLENGALGNLSGTGKIEPGEPEKQDLIFYGSQGVAAFDLLRGVFKVDLGSGESYEVRTDDVYPAAAPTRAFVDLIRGSQINPAPGETGARAVEMIEATYRSAREQRYVSIAEVRGA